MTAVVCTVCRKSRRQLETCFSRSINFFVIAERGTRHDDTDDDDNDDVSHVGEVWLDGERGGGHSNSSAVQGSGLKYRTRDGP